VKTPFPDGGCAHRLTELSRGFSSFGYGAQSAECQGDSMVEASREDQRALEELARLREEIRLSMRNAREQLDRVEQLLIVANLHQRALESAADLPNQQAP
jgi:hypothetical protein